LGLEEGEGASPPTPRLGLEEREQALSLGLIEFAIDQAVNQAVVDLILVAETHPEASF